MRPYHRARVFDRRAFRQRPPRGVPTPKILAVRRAATGGVDPVTVPDLLDEWRGLGLRLELTGDDLRRLAAGVKRRPGPARAPHSTIASWRTGAVWLGSQLTPNFPLPPICSVALMYCDPSTSAFAESLPVTAIGAPAA